MPQEVQLLQPTPWADDKENAATVYDQGGNPYDVLPFVLASDARIFERRMRAALTSAREELVRQRAIWTNGQNDLFAISCIVRELERIDAALSLSGASGKAQKASPPSAQADCSQGAIA